MAAEIANGREVRLIRAPQSGDGPDVFGQRKIVVDAGDHLHSPAVPMREADTVYGLRAGHVGTAVMADRNGALVGQVARHAGAPQHLIANLLIDKLMEMPEFVEASVGVGVDAGDEFQLRFTEIGGNAGMR